MVPNREIVYSALLTYLQKSAGFVTVTRVPLAEDAIAVASMPLLEQLPSAESAEEQGANLPVRWRIRQPLAVYVNTAGTPDQTGDTIMNNLIDKIEAALKPSPVTGYQTLGGIVLWARFKGVLLKEPGYQTTRGAALVLVEMLTTS